MFWISAAMITVFLLMAIWPSLFTSTDPTEAVLSESRKLPDSENWFGRDIQGYDIYSRCIYGARASILVGLFTTIGTVILGGTIGVISGYLGGGVDSFLSRIGDVFFAIPLLLSSIALFYAGIAFAYFIVFKVMFGFFARVVPGGVQMTPDISAYLSFVLGIFLTFGLAFEVPIATVLLIWSGLVSVKTLKGIRPYVFLGAFVAGMLLAPDVFSMTLMALPMYALYEAGLLMARVLVPEKMGVETAPASKS